MTGAQPEMVPRGGPAERPQRDATHDGVDPVAYLDAVTATEFARHYKPLTYSLLRAGRGSSILDVGCGTGEDVLALARLCAPGGQVTGIDANPQMIAESWRRLGTTGLPAVFRVASAESLPFADDTFDGVRTDRVLQHVADPRTALAEMVRVTRAGGAIAAVEPDWGTFAIDCHDPRIAGRIADYMATQSVQSGHVGRQLYRSMRSLGLQDVQVRAMPMVITEMRTADQIWGLERHVRESIARGFITAEEAREWQQELRLADSRRQFFSSVCGYLVSGLKGRPT
jgi:ubiquinone/menaquinone biosynthesis C-methylase UbiE